MSADPRRTVRRDAFAEVPVIIQAEIFHRICQDWFSSLVW